MNLIKIRNAKLYLTIFNLVFNRAFINRDCRSEPTFFRVSANTCVCACARVLYDTNGEPVQFCTDLI